MKLYVFPPKNQSKQKLKEDEFECYKWAVEQSGIDPLNLSKVEVDPVQSGPTGGAFYSAAAGAVIGAIAGDAGKGAALGSTAGGTRGASRGKQAQAQQNQQAQATASNTAEQMKEDYKKTFSVCIEGKGYSIS